ncbi:MAG: HAD family phosphatase [Candidatus Heimdallarchaeota archaeon]|nr:MAG: HAD family phosphatase [Candidatus Heimdallarchaeota archaeon]
MRRKEMNSFTTLILDCDGVIVDSEPFSCGAWNVVFEREYGIDIGTDYSAILGGTTQNAIEHYLTKYNLDKSEDIRLRLAEIKEQVYLEIAKGKLEPISGIQEIIKQARELGWKIGVASSGIMKKILFNLREANILEKFDAITGSEPHLRGKPYPDIYLSVAKQLKSIPRDCIVIEDTPSGITAAKRAGMYVIGITTTFPKKNLTEADRIIASYKELLLKDYLNLS